MKKMKFDLIVSNPPYIKNDEILDRSLGYEPQDALFAEEMG
jgi:release factor glutamine methyltransferase